MFKIKILALIIAVAWLMPAMNTLKAADDWDIRESEGAKSVTYTTTILFDADSLRTVKMPAIYVGPYSENLASLSFRSTAGTIKNYSITTYLSNWATTDTTFWTIQQVWDTTGIYLAKPVNDTVTIKISGLPVKYLYLKVRGLTANSENTTLDIAVTLYRKD